MIIILSPEGKKRKIYFIGETWCIHAYVWTSPFKRINQYAAGMNAIDNLVRRLEKQGWKVIK